MGRVKAGKKPRRSNDERIAGRIALRVGAAQAIVDKREAFLKAFGDVMTEDERAEYLRTGVFEE